MKNGRIAIPSVEQGGLEGTRSDHFGHCDVFTLVDVEHGQIIKIDTLRNRKHAQGGCMVPVKFLANSNVNALIVGGIGKRPLMGFRQVGIDIYYDAQHTDIKSAVEGLIAGKLPVFGDELACSGDHGHCDG
jgi:predicted Fe-Mo cluster-binding NifX family protein